MNSLKSTLLKNMSLSDNEGLYLTASMGNGFTFLGSLFIGLFSALGYLNNSAHEIIYYMGATSIAFTITAGISNRFRFQLNKVIGVNTFLCLFTLIVIFLTQSGLILKASVIAIYIIIVIAITYLFAAITQAMSNKTKRNN